MLLDKDIINSFVMTKKYKREGRMNHLDFSNDGLHLITSADDNKMVLYDCEKGVEKKVASSEKYGCDLVHFTHAKNCVIFASKHEGEDQSIRYLSLYDNKFIRYFSGHTKKVVSLSMSPVDDTVITSSLDNTVRLWDLRSPSCVGVLQCQGRPVASFGPKGLIFAVGVQSEKVKLYDVKNFHKGPFSAFKYKSDPGCDWTGIKFSPNDKFMMVTTNGAVIRVLDADCHASIKGKPLYTLQGYLNNKRLPIEASFTPDSQFIVGGSADGKLHIWRTESGTKVGELRGEDVLPVSAVKFNPRYFMMASGYRNLNLWLAKPNE